MAHTHRPGQSAGELGVWATVVVLQVVLVEIERRVFHSSGSTTILSDLWHNSSDVLQALISGSPVFVCFITGWSLSKLLAQRLDVVAGIVNIAALILSGVWAIAIGWARLHTQIPVDYEQAWPIVAVSCAVNTFCFLLVHRIKSVGALTYTVHMFWDIVATLIGAISLYRGSLQPTSRHDAQATIIMGLFMIFHWPVTWLIHRLTRKKSSLRA